MVASLFAVFFLFLISHAVVCQTDHVSGEAADDNFTITALLDEIVKKVSIEVKRELRRQLSKEFKGNPQCCSDLQQDLHVEQSRRQILEEKVDVCFARIQKLEPNLYQQTHELKRVLPKLNIRAKGSTTTTTSTTTTLPAISATISDGATTGTTTTTSTTTTLPATTSKNTTKVPTTTTTTTLRITTTASTTTTTTTTTSATVTTTKPTTTKPIVCPPEFFPFEGHCYLFEMEKQDWSRARGACTRRGAYLVSVNTQGEHNFLVKQIQSYYSTRKEDYFWLGMMSLPEKRLWLDGTDVTFSAWNSETPDCEGKGCKAVLSEVSGYMWELARRSFKFYYICEIGSS